MQENRAKTFNRRRKNENLGEHSETSNLNPEELNQRPHQRKLKQKIYRVQNARRTETRIQQSLMRPHKSDN